MIETKKERRESKMIKISYIITFLMVFIFFNTNSFAETKPDCSKYSTKTYLGLLDKMKCKKGLPVKERIKPKNEWELKDRIYYLKGDKKPLSRSIKSANVYYFDETKGHERELKYTQNQRLILFFFLTN